MKRKSRPFLPGYFEKTKVASGQIQQRLELLLQRPQFQSEVEIIRKQRGVPRGLTFRNDRRLPVDFFEKAGVNADLFFAQPFAQVIPPESSKWFLSQSKDNQHRLREDIWAFLQRFNLPKTNSYFYWMFNYLLYDIISEIPRSNVNFTDLAFPSGEGLTTGEKRLVNVESNRVKKQEPSLERDAIVKEKLSQKRKVRFRKSQQDALALQQSGKRPTEFAWDSLGVRNESTKNHERAYNRIRQAKSRFQKRQTSKS